MGWFVEGLAVYASEQRQRSHRNAARDAIAAGKAPKRLAEAWSGRYRYGVSGSVVEFVDRRDGQASMLLSNAEIDWPWSHVLPLMRTIED